MKKLKSFGLFLGIFTLLFSVNSNSVNAARIDAHNNIITSGRGIPSSMVSGRLFNQYQYKSGGGYVNVTVITYFERATANSPVKVKWITVMYDNQTNGSPYFSYLFVDKRAGGTVYPQIPKEHKMMKKGSHSFTITLNTTNVQSVQLYAHSNTNERYQYITAFY